jgi:hypothetical protein
LKDGTQTVTANIPFAGFKLTGVGPATARTDAATIATIQDGTGVYVGTVGGTGNAITLTPSPAITAYGAGQRFYFVPGSTNSGATTVAISGLAAKNIFLNGAACVGNEITLNIPATITYDGTQFNLVAPAHAVTTDTTQTISGAKTLTGTTTNSGIIQGTGIIRAGATASVLGAELLTVKDTTDNSLSAFYNTNSAYTHSILFVQAETAPSTSWLFIDGRSAGGSTRFQVFGDGSIKSNGVAVPTISSSDTLTNKTLTSPVINSATGIGQTVWKYKTAAENVASSATLQDDDHLVVAMDANASYEIRIDAPFLGSGNLNACGIKSGVTIPSGASVVNAWMDLITDSHNSVVKQASGGSFDVTTADLSTGGLLANCKYRFYVTTSSTSGNFVFRWAQSTSNATTLQLPAGSSLEAVRVL